MISITKLISYTDYNSFSGCDVVVTAQMAPITIDGETIQMDPHVLGSLQTISYSTHQDRAPVRSIGNINAIDYVQGQRTIAGTMVFAMFHEHWMTPLLNELIEKNCVSNADIWSDELPALNLTISMANEYGYKSNMVLYGVKFIEDGGVMSINDLYTENTLQYVATGIQPLKTSGQYDHSYTLTANKLKISNEYKTRSFEFSKPILYKKEWAYTPQTILPEGRSPVIPAPADVPVDIIIHQPIYVNKDYIITVDPVKPEDFSITNLWVVDIETGKEFPGYNPINNTWVVTVPDGIYSMIYVDQYGNRIMKSEFIITDDRTRKKPELKYPVISDIGPTTVTVLPPTDHDKVSLSEVSYVNHNTIDGIIPEELIREAVVYDIRTDTSIGRSNSKEINIENLKAETEYILQTLNSADSQDYSHTIRFKTFKSQQEKYDILKDYIMVNRNLLVDSNSTYSRAVSKVLSFDFDLLKYEYFNIIDAVLQCNEFEDEDVKTEISFYATKLQNEFNSLYNDYGVSNSISKNKQLPLSNVFDVTEVAQSLVVYKRFNDKSYFVTRTNAINNFQYSGKNNTRYYVQPILNDGHKGNYVDFICYNDQQKRLLSPYSNVQNLQNLSFINYETYAGKYDTDFLMAIKAAENLTIYREMFDMPYATYTNKTLIVDTNYVANDENIYYLCIALPEDALEYTPIRKIPFDVNVKELSVASYYSGVLKNKYYLLWIQDRNFNNVSEPFILSTYTEDYQITDYYGNKCNKYFKDIKNIFSTDSVYKYYVDLLYSEIIAIDQLKYKDIDLFVLQTFINMFGTNLNESLSHMLNMILDYIYTQHNHFVAKANIKNSMLSFSSDISHYVVAINITKDSIKKERCLIYDINQYDQGLTLLYAANSHSNVTSGYILINNFTKKIYASNIIVGGLTNGWLL